MTAYIGAGTLFEIGSTADPATSTWTSLPQVKNISRRAQTSQLDVTNLGSTAKEYIADLPDSAEIQFDVFHDPALATHDHITGLEALFNSRTPRAVRFRTLGTTIWTRYASCLVLNNDLTIDFSQPLMKSVTMKASGAPSYAV